MDFTFTEEQRQLRSTVTRALQRDYPFDQRQAIVASEDGWSADVWLSVRRGSSDAPATERSPSR